MIPTEVNTLNTRGKKVPGRPGRFDPSEPFHMSTRRATKTMANTSPSANGSIEGSDSRRGSFDDQRPTTGYSNGTQASTKSRRYSEASAPIATPGNIITGGQALQSSEEKMSDEQNPSASSHAQTNPSPSRKRKRSSPISSQAFEQASETFVDTSFNTTYNDIAGDDDEDDVVDVVVDEDMSDREATQYSAESDDEDKVNEDQDMVGIPLTNITPGVSAQVSPRTSGSGSEEEEEEEEDEEEEDDDDEEELPLPTPLEDVLDDVPSGAAVAAEDDEMEVEGAEEVDDIDEGEDADEGDEIEDQVRSDYDGRPRRGRFGGRRRAQHPIMKVELAMRRQAELKSAYRAIARSQKAILAEIALRTTDSLKTDPEAHVKAAEHQRVLQDLEDALEHRRYHVLAEHDYNVQQLKQTLTSEQRVIKAKCKQKFEELREAELDKLEYEVLKIARAAQLDQLGDSYETEDEDDVIPKLKGMSYRWRRKGGLESAYDSRSRLILETRRATADIERRFNMRDLLDSFAEEDEVKLRRGFTVMDSRPREFALRRQEGKDNAGVLLDAAADVERRSKIPVIRNEDAKGLQMLGDLASRPSINRFARESTDKHRKESMYGLSPDQQHPPPLRLPFGYGPSPIPVEMSPRTTHAMGSRFDTTMPPPTTPRQETASFGRSSLVARPERIVSSPTTSDRRLNGLHRGSMKPIDGRPSSSAGRPMESPRLMQDRLVDRPEYRLGRDFMSRPPEPRRFDFPTWRDFAPPGQTERGHHTMRSDRIPAFDLFNGPPFRREPQSPDDRRHRDGKQDDNIVKNESPSFADLRGQRPGRPMAWADQSSQPGASEDSRRQAPASSTYETHRFMVDIPTSPPSRKTSLSTHDFRPGNLLEDEKQRLSQKSSKENFQTKLNRAERGGIPRRQWSSEQRKLKWLGKPGASANSPPLASPTFATSPVDRPPPLAPWQPPAPQHSPVGAPPPLGPYHHASSYPAPSFSVFPSHHRGYDFGASYHHHSSSIPPPPPSSLSSWNPVARSPLYAVPQQQQHHPPPPGAPSDQFTQRYALLPPSNPYTNSDLPSALPPTSSHPSSSSSIYGPQFGGQPIAPAMHTMQNHPPGFRSLGGGPPPAFAQQQQQQQQQQAAQQNAAGRDSGTGGGSGNSGSRRRTQSDAGHFHKFQPWNPPNATSRR